MIFLNKLSSHREDLTDIDAGVSDETGEIVVSEEEVQYFEIAGLPEADPDDEVFPVAKKSRLVRFSVAPIKVCTSSETLKTQFF